MSIISLRMDEQEEKSENTLKVNNMTISELFRSSVLEKIEDDIELEIYHQTMKDHTHKTSDISFDEMINHYHFNVRDRASARYLQVKQQTLNDIIQCLLLFV